MQLYVHVSTSTSYVSMKCLCGCVSLCVLLCVYPSAAAAGSVPVWAGPGWQAGGARWPGSGGWAGPGWCQLMQLEVWDKSG